MSKIKKLKHLIEEIFLLAIRYAHGRPVEAKRVSDSFFEMKAMFPSFSLREDRVIRESPVNEGSLEFLFDRPKAPQKTSPSVKGLKKVFESLLPFAVLYANGRHTYVPDMVREAFFDYKKINPEYKLNIDVKPPKEEDLQSAFIFRSDWLDDLCRNEK